ncbi:hypothetical protein ILUMI_25931 [Ignelater luminosus]|uniref:PiggyBac transposable element-derived protein domain-containing protein n=1 Tax=Ignelater luminosus TaxID=2038154 RepID=A0A8K0FXL5_IGNLU|nr:hypothetical protein ILUMI_25931 [Ignelater luminosus]
MEQKTLTRKFYWKKPLSSHELLEKFDDTNPAAPLTIVIFPSENATDNATDEDSGDDEIATLSNLLGGQLKQAKCRESNVQIKEFPEWVEPNKNTPLELFELFFDHEIIEMLQKYINTYAAQKNCVGDTTTDEIKSFMVQDMLPGLTRTKVLPEARKTLGLGSSIILKYADVIQSFRKDYYSDNFFTSLPLLKLFAAKNLKATGMYQGEYCSEYPEAELITYPETSFEFRNHKLMGDSDLQFLDNEWRLLRNTDEIKTSISLKFGVN